MAPDPLGASSLCRGLLPRLPVSDDQCRDRDRRSPSAKRAARSAYEQKLKRAIERHFSGFSITRLTTGIDLEKSFGPIYARGLLRKGQTAFALLGVNATETQNSIDAALTFGILWLDLCRQSSTGAMLVEGLILFVPVGCSAVVRERMSNLNPSAAKWRLVEFDEQHDARHLVGRERLRLHQRDIAAPHHVQVN